MLGENSSAVIYVKAKTKDALGSFSSTTTGVIDIRGKFEKISGDKMAYNGRKEIIADFVFYCNIPVGLLVDESMTTMIDGREYAIAFVENMNESDVFYKMYLRTL